MHTTHIIHIDGSVMLVIPPAILDLLSLHPGTMVSIAMVDGRMIIDPKPQPTLDALLDEAREANIYPLSEEEREWIDAPAVGREIL